MTKRPAGLGRGLSALLGDNPAAEPSPAVRTLPVADLEPHPEQPRRVFDEQALDELAQSIATRGLIQPIVVRPWKGRFQIVAGERRWRAAQRARLHEVPVIVRDFAEAETLELALLENIQRQDLSPIEEADAYKKLIDRFGHTQDALSKIVHKSRSHVANLLRLLDLPEGVRTLLAEGRLSMGHAKVLIGAADAEALARQVADRGLSVRETEKLVNRHKPQRGRSKTARPGGTPDADLVALERQLADLLGLRVRVAYKDGAGQVELGFSSLEQLDMICQRLSGERI